MLWLPLAFLSALSLGFYDVFKKAAVRSNAVIPVLFLNTLFCSLLMLPLTAGSALGFIDTHSPLYSTPPTWEVHRYIFVKACIVLLSWICGYYGIKRLPLTIAGPINGTRPVLTLVGAYLIYGERLNAWQTLGVALAVLSFYLLSRSGKKEGISFVSHRGVLLVVAAALLGAMSGLYDKYLLAPTSAGGIGLSRIDVQSYYNYYQCAMMSIVMLTLWWPMRHAKPLRWSWAIPLVALFLTLADFAYFQALASDGALISVVSMVRRGNVLVSFAIAAIVFREKNLRSKSLDLLLVLLSLVCLWIGRE